MSRSAALLALLSLCICACSRSTPVQHAAPDTAAPPAVTQTQPEAATPKAESAPTSENEQAATAQESGADDVRG